jgi:hypothetical protein
LRAGATIAPVPRGGLRLCAARATRMRLPASHSERSALSAHNTVTTGTPPQGCYHYGDAVHARLWDCAMTCHIHTRVYVAGPTHAAHCAWVSLRRRALRRLRFSAAACLCRMAWQLATLRRACAPMNMDDMQSATICTCASNTRLRACHETVVNGDGPSLAPRLCPRFMHRVRHATVLRTSRGQRRAFTAARAAVKGERHWCYGQRVGQWRTTCLC